MTTITVNQVMSMDPIVSTRLPTQAAGSRNESRLRPELLRRFRQAPGTGVGSAQQ